MSRLSLSRPNLHYLIHLNPLGPAMLPKPDTERGDCIIRGKQSHQRTLTPVSHDEQEILISVHSPTNVLETTGLTITPFLNG